MGLFDWLTGKQDLQTIELKDYRDAGSTKMSLPKVPWPDVSGESLVNYSRRSEIVYACIEKKAQAATDPEIYVEQRNKQGEWQRIDDHPATQVIKRPNPYEDGETFMRAWIASENVSGVFFAEKVMTRSGQLAELYPLIPTNVYARYKRTARGDELDYYEYYNGGVPVRFEPDDLLIRRKHSRGSVLSGMSPLQVALGSVDADIAATEYVRAFFNNDGTPSGILKISGRRLSDEDAQRLQQRWAANYARYGKNRGGTAILDESAEYQTIGAKLNELESETLTSIDESRICMAFGVPPILIGAYVGLVHVNQRASVKEAQQDFWMNTMSPELKQIRHFLTQFVLPLYEDPAQVAAGNVRFNWDMSQVDALQEDVEKIHKRAQDDFKAGIVTLNEARETIGLEPVDGEEGDAFYKAPAPQVGQPGQGDGQDNQDDTAKRLHDAIIAEIAQGAGVRKMLHGDSSALLQIGSTEGLQTNGNGLKKKYELDGMTLSREPSPLEMGIDLKAIFDSYEKGRESLGKVIQTMRKDLIGQAVKAVGEYGDKDIHELTLTPPGFAQKSVTREIKKAFDEGRIQVAGEAAQAGSKHLFIMSEPAVVIPGESKGILDDLIREIVDITISRVIGQVSSAAIGVYAMLRTLGRTPDEIEAEMEQKLDEYSDAPYDAIARQMINRAVNEGRREEMRQRDDEIDYYVYSAILDPAVCENCEPWDGATADDPAQLPDTPNPECLGGPNCRCFVVAVFKSENN